MKILAQLVAAGCTVQVGPSADETAIQIRIKLPLRCALAGASGPYLKQLETESIEQGLRDAWDELSPSLQTGT